jgi:serine/threonine protein kinase
MAARKIAPGDVIAGKFRVQKVLGQGGMGVVVVARDRDLARPVAIKQLLPEWVDDKDCVARFLREARSAVKLTSEHTVRVFDAGLLPGGVPYMVMEYLTGKDLGAMLGERGPLPAELAVGYILQACEGLAEAHVSGIVHRDLKPPNLFVTTRPDGSELVKVLDYGLAKATHPGEAQLTKTSATLGSPLYLSPELLGRARHVDVRTDVWSLGVTLYELVTGRLPFVASTIYEIFASIQRDTPMDPAAIRPLPPGLSAVILRCLAKNPLDRWKDVADLADALVPFGGPQAKGSAERVRRVLETTVPFVRPPSDPPVSGETKTTAIYDSDSGKTRRRVAWVVIAGVALAAATTGTVLLVKVRTRHPSIPLAEPRPTPVPAGSIWVDAAPAETGRVIAVSDGGVPAAPPSAPRPPKHVVPHAPTASTKIDNPFDHP